MTLKKNRKRKKKDEEGLSIFLVGEGSFITEPSLEET